MHQFGFPAHIGNRRVQTRGYIGNPMNIDPLEHEPQLVPVLKKILSARQGTFLDVGVNLGQTLIKVLTIEPGRAYIGFEPQIGCCYFVDQFLKDNGFSHASVMPVALSDREDILNIHASGAFDEMASLSPDEGAQRDGLVSTKVPVQIGDKVVNALDINAVSVLKIDVEGLELQVIRGLIKTIKRFKPVLIFEVLPNFSGEARTMHGDEICRRNNINAAEIYSLLTRIGYQINQLDHLGCLSTIQGFDLDDREGFKGFEFVAFDTSENPDLF